MNAADCVVAVDVGNTAVKFAVSGDGEVVHHVVSTRDSDWQRAVVHWAQETLACESFQWLVASVCEAACNQLRAVVSDALPDAMLRLVTRDDVPMRVEVDHPDRVGIDRLLGAFAACNRLGGPVIVVDAGSAITVDWVGSDGAFHGGAILPGLALQAQALANGTEALPEIGWTHGRQLSLPAKNTQDAIRSGILTGAAASIDALANAYAEPEPPNDLVKLVVTGGDAPVIAPLLRRPHLQIENLVCHGLLELPAKPSA